MLSPAADIIALAKARNPRNLETWRRRKASERNQAERAYIPSLTRWFDQFALEALRDVRPQVERAMRDRKVSRIRKLGRVPVRKDIDRTKIEQSLLEIFSRFGLRTFDQAGQDAAAAVRGRWELKPDIVADYNDKLQNKVVLLVEETETRVRESVRRVVSDALRESPRPSAREVGRRLARQWMGPPDARPVAANDVWPGRGTEEEGRVTADWARTQEALAEGGQEFVFSAARAQTIARTEIAQAQSAATAESMVQADIDEVDWLPKPYNQAHDRPGARNHFLMAKHPPITVKAMNGKDIAHWFELPSGVRAPYPNWIGLPAGETVNCQCILVPSM